MAVNPSSAASGYKSGGGAAVGMPGTTNDKSGTDYWPLTKCKRAYLDYLSSKRLEIDEQQEARRYRHGAHWTSTQVEALNKRKQPVVTYNRIGRKINGVVGLVEKLRQDPKAYPRTPKHEEGAELATAVIRYALDQQDWKAKSPICAESGAVDGIGGIELELEQGDQEDKEVGFEIVDTDGFFYDPRSFRMDFSDATYMGMGKWLDPEVAKELIPGKDEEIDRSIGDNSDLTSNSDRDDKWFFTEGDRKRIRLVDIWYRHKGEWCWALFTGSSILMEGKSYLVDEKQKTICKFIMFSAAVDHDGDRYGFVRDLKSANDEINQRRSKGLHELNTRRIIARKGQFDDIEITRREAARPDGVVEWNAQGSGDTGPEFDDSKKQADIQGQLAFLEDAKAEIENFGPNPALIGTGVNAKSGRAIALMQEAGIAELGPYILAYRGWKLRVYRAVFNAIRTNWMAERWIRVTDNDGLAQFVQINAMQTDPMTGVPTMVNAIGQLDVDIILDEGPDTINMMQDMYETLSQIVPSLAPLLAPAEGKALIGALIDVSPMDAAAKKKYRDAGQQAAQQPPPPDPAVEAKAKMAEIDMQTKLADQQLAERQAAQDMQLAKMRASNDIEIARAQAEADLAIAREKAEAEIQAMHVKNAAAVNCEQEKVRVQLQGEQDRANVQRELKTFEGGLKLAEMDRKSKFDADADDRKSRMEAEKQEGQVGGSQGLKTIVTGIDKLTKNIDQLSKDVRRPKKISLQRGGDGSIRGATVS